MEFHAKIDQPAKVENLNLSYLVKRLFLRVALHNNLLLLN